jgi:hypothetical protein
MANRPIIQNSTLTDENGVTALSVATGGAVTRGPAIYDNTMKHTTFNHESQRAGRSVSNPTANTWYAVGECGNITYGIIDIFAWAGLAGTRHNAKSFRLHVGVALGSGTNPVVISNTFAGSDAGIEVQLSGTTIQVRVTTTANTYLNAHMSEHLV